MIIATKLFRVVGVIGSWNPEPHFDDLGQGAFAKPDQVYLPFFTWLGLPQDDGWGPMRCWGNNPGAGEHNPKAPQCAWA